MTMSGWLNTPVYGALLGLLYHQAITYLLGKWRMEDFNYGYASPYRLLSPLGETGRAKQYPPVPSGGANPDWGGHRSVLFLPPQSVVAIFLLRVTLLVSRNVDFREKIAEQAPGPFSLTVCVSNEARTALEPRFLDGLKLSDYALIDYQDRERPSTSTWPTTTASGKGSRSLAKLLSSGLRLGF
jgi:hypothetical protein